MGSWKISKTHSGISLQAFLKLQFPDASAKAIKRSIDAGKCLLNGRSERFSTRLVGTGDTVEFHAMEQRQQKSGSISENILYADEVIVAYNKTSGVVSDSKRLNDELTQSFGDVILLHRLDKETTGVLLFARTKAAASAIEEQFKKRQIKKTYLALVDGIPQNRSGRIANFLGKISVYEGQALWGSVTEDKGSAAITEWKVEAQGKQASLIRCFPQTGRTHQLRVHLSGLGHPILGDHYYGKTFKCRYAAPRIMLHAAEIEYEHPTSKKKIVISAPIPEDMKEAIVQLVKTNG